MIIDASHVNYLVLQLKNAMTTKRTISNVNERY